MGVDLTLLVVKAGRDGVFDEVAAFDMPDRNSSLFGKIREVAIHDKGLKIHTVRPGGSVLWDADYYENPLSCCLAWVAVEAFDDYCQEFGEGLTASETRVHKFLRGIEGDDGALNENPSFRVVPVWA